MQLVLELSALLQSEVLLCHCSHLTLVSYSSLTSFGTRGSSCTGKVVSGSLVKVSVCDMMIPQSEGSAAQQKPAFSAPDFKVKDKFR